MKESACQIHPLHATVLNFHEVYRRKCIVSGETFIAFLPTSFYTLEDEVKHPANADRAQKLRLLHKAMEIALEDLRKFEYPGFECNDGDGIQRMCHPCLVSYCCDLPESKDLSSARNGNMSLRNCHRCFAETKNFNTFTAYKDRSSQSTIDTIHRAIELRKEGKKDDADALMDEYSLFEQMYSL